MSPKGIASQGHSRAQFNLRNMLATGRGRPLGEREDVGGLRRAERRGIPAVAVPRKAHRDVKAFNDALHAELEPHDPDLVLCLGFLSPFELRGRYEGRALNVHPALIPAFSGRGYYGRRVHEAVLEAGVKLTGATVHFVDSGTDTGPIIAQAVVPVNQDDAPESLKQRILAQEHRLYPMVVRMACEGRLKIEGRTVRVSLAAGESTLLWGMEP